MYYNLLLNHKKYYLIKLYPQQYRLINLLNIINNIL